DGDARRPGRPAPVPAQTGAPADALLVRVHRLELAGLDLALDLLLDLRVGERGHLSGLDLAPDLPLTEAPELEDLEHYDEVEARGERQGGEAEHESGPAGVQVAVVVRVGHEAERQR